MIKAKVDLNQVTITPGWYNQTLNEKTKKTLNAKKVALVWVDCDLYESTVPVLRFITDYLQDGTIVIFDDWFCYRGNPNKGEQKAFREWLKNNRNFSASQYIMMPPFGNSFIMHKK